MHFVTCVTFATSATSGISLRLFLSYRVTRMKNFGSTCYCKRSTYEIKLKPMADMARLAFIDRVCALLIESRFGPYAIYESIVELNDPFETRVPLDEMPDEFFDLMPQSWMPPLPHRGFRKSMIKALV